MRRLVGNPRGRRPAEGMTFSLQVLQASGTWHYFGTGQFVPKSYQGNPFVFTARGWRNR